MVATPRTIARYVDVVMGGHALLMSTVRWRRATRLHRVMYGGESSVRVRLATSLRAWAMASRPHTLTISVNPVLVGCALAWAETGHIDVALMLLSVLGALLLQA